MYEEQLRQAITTIRKLRADLDEARASEPLPAPIALVGIGCRFPGGADTAEAFADLLEAGTDTVIDTPPDRWDAEQWFDADPDVPGRICSKRGAFLPSLDQFDAAFFEMSEREALEMDPQHRLLLITAWEALENAAIAPASVAGSRTGVYVGINGAEYYQSGIADPALITAHTLSGGVASAAAGRIAYQFDLAGPAVAIDTACSSSLAAVHNACRALRAKEVDMALAGGVYVVLDPNLSVGLSRLRMLAPDGCCKPFDAAANGFVQGEGAGMVVLKRLDDARRDADPVLAVIRGSAMNQDGRSVSLTAPSRDAQKQVIQQALLDAGVDPADVGYVETHGTGTALGDPIEAHALGDVFGSTRTRLMLGAVKSNIGHLGPAAGIAGLIKTVQVLRRGVVPGTLHFNALNPQIDTGDLQLDLPRASVPFPDKDAGRLAGLSSFGFAGTNVHLVLEAADGPTAPQPPSDETPGLLCLSARSPAALEVMRGKMISFLASSADFAATCRSAAFGRNALEHRLFVVASSASEAALALGSATVVASHRRARLAVYLPQNDPMVLDWLSEVDLTPHVILSNEPLSNAVAPVLSPQDPNLAEKLSQMRVTAVLCRTRVDLPENLDPSTLVLTCDGHTPHTRLHLFGQLFQAGFSPDPQGFTSAGARIALPLTPMEPHATWRVRAASDAAVSSLPGADLSGPPPGARYRLVTGLKRHPWLTDHRVQGRTLVPGAFQIATLLLAAQAQQAMVVGLRHVAFLHPFALNENDDHELWTQIDPDGALSLTSRALLPSSPWVRHAQAETIVAETNVPKTPSLRRAKGITPFKSAEAQTDGAAWRAELADMGIDLGPAFAGLEWMQRANGQARARIVPVAGRLHLDGTLHPAFLDACLQTAGGTLDEDLRHKPLLPIGVDRFEIFALPDGPVTVEATGRRDGDTVVIDLVLICEAGHLLAEVQGLSVRPLDVTPAARQDMFQLVQVAQPKPMPATSANQVARRFIVGGSDMARALRPALADQDQMSEPGDPYDVTAVGSVVFVADPATETLDPAIELCTRVAASDSAAQVTFAALGPVSPQSEALAGLAATLRMEVPQSHARFVQADQIGALITELDLLSQEDRVQVSKTTRHVARLRSLQLDPQEAPLLGGTAILSGAFGGLGRPLAEWITARGVCAIVLIGRAPDRAFVKTLTADTDCTVQVCALDLAHVDADQHLISTLKGLPPVQAVYHAAGAQAPGVLSAMTPGRFAQAYDGKVKGAQALDRATQGHPVTEFVMMSSLASLFGAAGQGGYGAANAALDGLAQMRRAQGLPALSLRLGRIAQAGMAEALDDTARARIDALGLRPMPINTILSGIATLLASSDPCPILADVDWPAFAARHPSGHCPPLLAELVGDGLTAASAVRRSDPRSAQAAVQTDPFLEAIRAIASIAGDIVINEDRSLVQLGFDSLMAIELRARLRKSFGASPSIADILGQTSLAELRAQLPLAAVDPARLTAQEAETPDSDEWESLVL